MDRLLIRGHAPADRLRDDTGQDPEQAQDDERSRVGRRREHGREQGAAVESQLDQRDDALVDVELGHALGRVGQIPQNRRQPFLEEHAVGVVAGVIDRALRLRAGAGEVDDQAVVALGERHSLRVQAWRIDAVVFGVVFPHVRSVRDLGQELAPERLGGALQDRVEAGFDLLATVAAEEIAEPLGPHAARRDFAVEISAQAVGQPRVPHHDLDEVVVRHSGPVESDGRHDQPLLVGARGMRGHGAGHRASDVVVMAEGLDERHDDPVGEDRDRHAEIGQVPDPPPEP